MKKSICVVLGYAFLLAVSVSVSASLPHPQPVKSFNISHLQQAESCPYRVDIATSCSSRSYTRDQISLAFGDAYGNQVYAPRLDDPSTGTFERCSTDTFQIYGPCAYQICYAYLYRSGTDGWIPESVSISGYNTRAVTFFYNVLIPGDIWYGFNMCGTASSSNQLSRETWLMTFVLGSVLMFIL